MPDEAANAISHPSPRYWKSPEAWQGLDPAVDWNDREFPEGATVSTETDRRTFLKLMGASMGLAGAGLGAGCRYPERTILPYSKQPEQVIPGVPLFYASAMPGFLEHLPLIVETHQARPTKIEGNPSYAPCGGASTSFAQASILDLYDPDRLQRSSRAGAGAMTPEQVRSLVRNLHNRFANRSGAGLGLLLEPDTSPTRARLIDLLRQAMPEAVVATYAPTENGACERAHRQLFGRSTRPRLHLQQTRRILALDSDFLATEPGHLSNARAFAEARKIRGPGDTETMARLYCAESGFTLTGGQADHRLRIASSHVSGFVALVLAEALEQTGMAGEFNVSLRQLRQRAREVRANVDSKWIAECVRDLLDHRGASLVVAGPHLPDVVHEYVFALNQLLRAPGKTVSYPQLPESRDNSLPELVAAMHQGRVETLVVIGGNPVYDAPADLDFKNALGNVQEFIRHGYHPDETMAAANIVIAKSHYLEAWSDGRAWDGTYVPVQPMISPLFETFSETELLELLGTGEIEGDGGYKAVHDTFRQITGDDSQLAFDSWLAEGVLSGTEYPGITSLPDVGEAMEVAARADLSLPTVGEDSLELRFLPSPHAFDGRYNNNGWLMECPDPMTKLTWDNAILVSPKLAGKLGILPDQNKNSFQRGREFARMGRIQLRNRTVEGPLHIQPGLADWTVVLHLGFGREVTGAIGTRLHDPGKGDGIGFNVYPLMSSTAQAMATGASIEVLDGDLFPIANTQEHWSMEGRAIIREANADFYHDHPDFVDEIGAEAHSPAIYGAAKDASVQEKALTTPRGGSLYDPPQISAPPPNYKAWNTEEGKEAYKEPQQWGMAIDLNNCLGCNACVIACQSENNIPIVGKDQVSRGREMHWIRLDRYYSADPSLPTNAIPEDPQVSFMGLACVHCELAPCEQVCPVNATVHDREGLNVMAYNRCVGTRYCANNCPYKVRRFNFFDYNKRLRGKYYQGPIAPNYYDTDASELTRQQANPDVTVRMRGVMEKCTYCVQRIQEAKIQHKVDASKAGAMADTHVEDGVIKVACQQTCPTGAIVFGDISDPNSEVSKLKALDRDYSLLGYLNVRPRTTYLARLRNPNPAMPGAHKQPYSRQEFDAANPHEHYGDHGHNGHGDAHDSHGAGHDGHHGDNGHHGPAHGDEVPAHDSH